MSRDERLSLVDWEDPELSIRKQAALLSMNRSSLYYTPVPPSPEDLIIKHRIDAWYTKYPFYGSRWIFITMNAPTSHLVIRLQLRFIIKGRGASLPILEEVSVSPEKTCQGYQLRPPYGRPGQNPRGNRRQG
jgi:hypothetical protein